MRELLKLLGISPQIQQKHEAIRRLATTQVYFDAIVPAVNKEGRFADYMEDLRRDFVIALSQDWLNKEAPTTFPHVDELVIEEGWTVKATNYDQRDTHQKLTLRQLGAWIDAQKHHLNLR